MRERNAIKPILVVMGLVLLFRFPLTAQVNHYAQIDSLGKLLQQARTDTARASVLSTLAQYYFPVNTDSGFAYAQKALQLSRKLGWKKGEVLALKAIGSNYWAKADYLKCQDYFLKMKDIALETNDPSLLSIAYHELAISYLPFGNTKKGIEYLQKALTIDQKSGDPTRLMALYHNLGDIYEGMHDFSRALFYYERSLPFAIKANYGLGLAYTYLKLGTLNVALNTLPKGIDYLQKSLALARSLKEQPVIVLALISSGEVYRKQRQYQKAVAYYDSALTISATFTANYYVGLHGTYLFSIADLYREKARVETQKGRTRQASSDLLQAKTYLKKALRVSGSVSDWAAMRDQARLLSEIYQEKGQVGQAFQAYKNYISYRDSVINIEKAEQRIQHEMEVVYQDSLQYIKKLEETQVHILAQENKLNGYRSNQLLLFSALALIIVAMIASVFLYRNRLQKIRLTNALQTEKLQKEWREAELQRKLNDMTLSALHSQMNPHFIFNALNTIQSFIYTNDRKAATLYLGKFSELIRKILHHSQEQFITLDKEMELIQLYTDIEKTRFGNNLKICIDVDSTVNTDTVLIPPLLIQPYVENAIKHGLLHKEGEKILLIKATNAEDESSVQVIIDDNGIGRSRSAGYNLKRDGHQSFANSANEKRVNLMNHLAINKIGLTIHDKLAGDGISGGTTVIFCFPVNSSLKPGPNHESALT